MISRTVKLADMRGCSSMPLSMFIGRCTGYGSRPDDPVLHRCVLPQIGIATLELLERLGVDVVYPMEQTCCGQPMANSGCYEEARATEDHCARVFGSFEYVVTPSGSCTHHIGNKFTAGADSPEKESLVRNTYDLVEFLHDVLKVREFPGRPLSTKWHFTEAAYRKMG